MEEYRAGARGSAGAGTEVDPPQLVATAELPKAVRLDKSRRLNEMRAMACEMGIISAADGSARMRAGDTCVVVAVYGPRRHRNPSAELPGRMVIDVSVTGPKGGFAAPPEREMELVLKQLAEEVVHVRLHPRTLLSVVVQVVDDSGSATATAVNALGLALLDAAVPMACTVAAVCCAVPGVDAGATAAGKAVGAGAGAGTAAGATTAPSAPPVDDAGVGSPADVLLDLSTTEEGAAAFTGTFAFKGVMQEGLSLAAADPDALLLSLTSGAASTATVDNVLAAAAAACSAVLAFVSQARLRCV